MSFESVLNDEDVADVDDDVKYSGTTPHSSEDISPIVSFLVANRNKLMQICLETCRDLTLEKFDFILQKIMMNDYRTALITSKQTTVLILDILDINKISYY